MGGAPAAPAMGGAPAALAKAFQAFNIDLTNRNLPRAEFIALLTRPGGMAALSTADAEAVADLFGSDGHFDVSAFMMQCRSLSDGAAERPLPPPNPAISKRDYMHNITPRHQAALSGSLVTAAKVLHARLSDVTFAASGHDAALVEFNAFMDAFASAARRADSSEASFRANFGEGRDIFLTEAAVRYWKAAASKYDTPTAALYYIRLASAAFRAAGIASGADAKAFARNFDQEMAT